MAIPYIPEKAKYFVGIIAGSSELVLKAEKKLISKYGPFDLKQAPVLFGHTTYYKKLGNSLFKYFFAFQNLYKREDIIKIKLFTNKLEKKLSSGRYRKINIDPGYLTLSNVYLASCKEYFHRTYLSKGVYLENEYYFQAKKFNFWNWTYPDYKQNTYLEFFYQLRNIYYSQLKGT